MNIVGLTAANVDHDEILRVKLLGMKDVFEKPICRDQLEIIVQKYVLKNFKKEEV